MRPLLVKQKRMSKTHGGAVRRSRRGVDTDVLSVRFTGRPVYRLPMSLRPPAGQPFDVIIPLVGRDAVVALANGSILAPGAQLDVGALRGAVAASPPATEIDWRPAVDLPRSWRWVSIDQLALRPLWRAPCQRLVHPGENVRQQLQSFLADVAGIPDSRVHVIEGRRRMPRRPEGHSGGPSEDIRSAVPARLYDLLGRDPKIWRLVEKLFHGSVPLADFEEGARKYGITAPDLIFAMSRAAHKSTDQEEERLAPIRLHAFERAVAGIWSCINPECAASPLDWQFGRVLSERADQCPSCSAPVLEVVSCIECGEAYLEGIEAGPRLSAPLRNPPRDEFAFDSARENGAEGADDAEGEAVQEETILVQDRLFAANPTGTARGFWLDRKNEWRVVDGPDDGIASFLCEEHNGPRACPHCSPEGRISELIRPLRFGAPFILGNAAPILLEGVEPAKVEAGEKLPSGGRRLLSFADSRQGTARMAAKLQIESERNFLRSFVYHQVQASMRPAPGADEELAKTKTEIEQLEAALAATRLPALEGVLAEKRRKLAILASGNTEGIAWLELVSRLAERVETSEWIKGVWQARDEQLFADASKIAEFLLLREFARRPRRANSAETLGIARLRNPSIDRLTEAQLPNGFRGRGRTIEDWRTYVDAVLTWYVRANGAISISWQMQALGIPEGEIDIAGWSRRPDRWRQETSRLAERLFPCPAAIAACSPPCSGPRTQS